MGPHKRWLIVALAALIIEVALSAGALYQVYHLGMLPNQYVMILCAVIVVLVVLTALLLFFRLNRRPTRARRAVRVVALVLAALVCVASAGIWAVAAQVDDTLQAVTLGGDTLDSASKSDTAITDTPFVVYISGSDTRSATLETSRSDVNILMAVDPVNRQILLLNTPRDYYVANPAGNGAMDKLTHLGLSGISNSMQGLADLYDTDVDYYAQINFSGFETLIDAIGGITVYSDVAFTSGDGYSFVEGENQMNGEQALSFARDRYNQTTGDNARGEHQMMVIEAVIQKLTSSRTDLLFNYSSILNSLSGMLSTNFSSADIAALVKEQLNGGSWSVTQYAVTGADGSEYTYSMPDQKAYVMYQDPQMVATASEMLRKISEGEKLES